MEMRLVIRKQAKKVRWVSAVTEGGQSRRSRKGGRAGQARGTVKFHRKSKSGVRELPRV